MSLTTNRSVVRVNRKGRAEVSDQLVAEAPLEIRLGPTPLAVIMRTPGHDADLVLGFAITEGMVLGPSEVTRVTPVDPEGNRRELVLAPGVEIDPEQFRRNMYATSSCGVCGKASIDAVRVSAMAPPVGPELTEELLLRLPDAMRSAQETFELTGGLHAAAAFGADGTMLGIREDIGRHNAVDKLIGSLARQNWPLGELILLVSGRVSFEIVQKAAVAGIPVVAGISAVSSLAADLGEELGLTVIGFLRDGSFNVYSGGARLVSLTPGHGR